MEYQRCDYGYISDDRGVFIERGAPMSGGGTAWLIWYRADQAELTVDRFGVYETATGHPARSLDHLTGGAATGTGYLHRNDAGSLTEAKDTAARVLADREGARR